MLEKFFSPPDWYMGRALISTNFSESIFEVFSQDQDSLGYVTYKVGSGWHVNPSHNVSTAIRLNELVEIFNLQNDRP